MDTNTDHFTPLALHVWGNCTMYIRQPVFFPKEIMWEQELYLKQVLTKVATTNLQYLP